MKRFKILAITKKDMQTYNSLFQHVEPKITSKLAIYNSDKHTQKYTQTHNSQLQKAYNMLFFSNQTNTKKHADF